VTSLGPIGGTGAGDGGRILESQVINKTSKMLVTHALATTKPFQQTTIGIGDDVIKMPFSKIIEDVGLGGANVLSNIQGHLSETKLSLADDPQRIDSTTSGTDFVAHVTLEKQNTNVPPPPSNEEKGHLETTKTCNNNHVNNKPASTSKHRRLVVTNSVESAEQLCSPTQSLDPLADVGTSSTSPHHHLTSPSSKNKSKFASSEESFESLQMRDMISDLQSAIKVERQQSLSWMEKHNKVRDALRLAAAEADEFKDTIDKQGSELSGLKQNMRKSKEEGEKMRERVELLSNSVQQQKDEICQLSTLYKTERDATLALQKALSSEKENFNRLMSSLKNERLRSKQAGERDSDTIIDLRTALEVERELRAETGHSNPAPHAPSPAAWGQSLVGESASRSTVLNTPQLYSSLSLGSLPTSGSLGHFPPFINEDLREESVEQEDFSGQSRGAAARQLQLQQQLSHRGPNQHRGTQVALAQCKRLERELREERDRVDALKNCLEQERDQRKILQAELVRTSKKLSDSQLAYQSGADRLTAGSGSCQAETKKQFFQRRQSSPQLNMHQQMNQSSLTLTSSSSLNNLSPIQVQMQEEALVMERRRSETLKVDKMRIEHCLEQAKRKIQRMSQEIVNLRGRIRLHSQIKSDSAPAQYHQFYIHDLEAKLDAYRRREAELSEDIDSARKLVKKLQVENTDLVKREKHKVELLVAGQGGIGDIVDIEDEDEEDNEDSRPNLEFIPSPLPSRSAPAATTNDSCCRAKSSPRNSKVEKLTALNESLNDQIRLLENRLMRIRQDHREEIEAVKAAATSNSCNGKTQHVTPHSASPSEKPHLMEVSLSTTTALPHQHTHSNISLHSDDTKRASVKSL